MDRDGSSGGAGGARACLPQKNSIERWREEEEEGRRSRRRTSPSLPPFLPPSMNGGVGNSQLRRDPIGIVTRKVLRWLDLYGTRFCNKINCCKQRVNLYIWQRLDATKRRGETPKPWRLQLDLQMTKTTSQKTDPHKTVQPYWKP
jgi:hypothetical protein